MVMGLGIKLWAGKAEVLHVVRGGRPGLPQGSLGQEIMMG